MIEWHITFRGTIDTTKKKKKEWHITNQDAGKFYLILK